MTNLPDSGTPPTTILILWDMLGHVSWGVGLVTCQLSDPARRVHSQCLRGDGPDLRHTPTAIMVHRSAEEIHNANDYSKAFQTFIDNTHNQTRWVLYRYD